MHALVFHQIGHRQRQYDRNAKFRKLGDEKQVASQIGCISHGENDAGSLQVVDMPK